MASSTCVLFAKEDGLHGLPYHGPSRGAVQVVLTEDPALRDGPSANGYEVWRDSAIRSVPVLVFIHNLRAGVRLGRAGLQQRNLLEHGVHIAEDKRLGVSRARANAVD